jgi:hypothetical protein
MESTQLQVLDLQKGREKSLYKNSPTSLFVPTTHNPSIITKSTSYGFFFNNFFKIKILSFQNPSFMCFMVSEFMLLCLGFCGF